MKKIEATEQKWEQILAGLAALADDCPKFTYSIHRYVFELTRELACNAPDCPFCLCRTADEFADFMEAKKTAHTN